MNTLLNELEVCRLFTTISLWTHTVRSHKLATHSNEVNNMGPHTWIEVELMHLVMFCSFENGSVHRRYRLMSKAFFSFPGLLHMICTQVVHDVSLYNLYTLVVLIQTLNETLYTGCTRCEIVQLSHSTHEEYSSKHSMMMMHLLR